MSHSLEFAIKFVVVLDNNPVSDEDEAVNSAAGVESQGNEDDAMDQGDGDIDGDDAEGAEAAPSANVAPKPKSRSSTNR